MAYFITASASASVVQTTFDTTGSIVTSSLYTPNDPINVDNIVYVQKGSSKFPNLSRPVFKYSLSFLYNGQSISWLYDTTSSRDSDYNLIKTLNTNYAGGGLTPGGKTDSIQFNGGGFFDGSGNFIFNPSSNTVEITGSLKVAQGAVAGVVDLTGASSVSGSIFSGSFVGDGSGLTGIVADESTLVQIECKNTSGGSLTQGTPVYVTGTVGATSRVEVSPASSSLSAKMPAIGLLKQDLANNGEGFIVISGLLTGISTDPINGDTPDEGDVLYVHSNGGLTINKPSGSNLIQNVGKVGKVSGGSAGSIIVSSIMRSNDVPNLLHNNIFYGSGSNQTYQIHLSGALDTTVINNITASGNISASGYVSASSFSGDGSGLTNVPESNDIDVFLNFEEARSYAYIVPYDLQFAGFTTSSAFTAQFSSSGAPYTFGTTLNQFDTLAVTSSAAGLITLSGSKI